jgi:cytochrome c553
MWFRKISFLLCVPGKGGLVSHVNQTAPLRTPVRWPAALAAMLLAIPLLWLRGNSAAQQPNGEPPVRVPSNVAWTRETLALLSSGDPFRGLLLARRCNHCHGEEGFSAVPVFPNLAGEDRLSFWKQMEEFSLREARFSSDARAGRRTLHARLSGFGGVLFHAAHRQRSARQPIFSPSHAGSFARLNCHPPHAFRGWPARHTAMPSVPWSSKLRERSSAPRHPERKLFAGAVGALCEWVSEQRY